MKFNSKVYNKIYPRKVEEVKPAEASVSYFPKEPDASKTEDNGEGGDDEGGSDGNNGTD